MLRYASNSLLQQEVSDQATCDDCATLKRVTAAAERRTKPLCLSSSQHLQMWHRAVHLLIPPGMPDLQQMWLQLTQANFNRDNCCRQSGCTDIDVCGTDISVDTCRGGCASVFSQILPLCGLICIGYICTGCSLASSYWVEKSQLRYSAQIDCNVAERWWC